MINPNDVQNILQKARKTKWSKHAFNCNKCPETGCPAWLDFRLVMQNIETKQQVETRLEGCSFVLNPILQADILETTSRSHASSCDTQKLVRNVDTNTKKGIIALAQIMGNNQLQLDADNKRNPKYELKSNNKDED